MSTSTPAVSVPVFQAVNAPAFAGKIHDVADVYVGPIAYAVGLSIDETSWIQAFDRIRPGLPIKPGRLLTIADGHKRHGTKNTFGALNVHEGRVIDQDMQRHRHQEFVRCLRAAVPSG